MKNSPTIAESADEICLKIFLKTKLPELHNKYPYIKAEALTNFATDFAREYFRLALKKAEALDAFEASENKKDPAARKLCQESFRLDYVMKGHAAYFYHRMTANYGFAFEYEDKAAETAIALSASNEDLLKLSHSRARKLFGSIMHRVIDVSGEHLGEYIPIDNDLPKELKLDWRAIVRGKGYDPSPYRRKKLQGPYDGLRYDNSGHYSAQAAGEGGLPFEPPLGIIPKILERDYLAPGVSLEKHGRDFELGNVLGEGAIVRDTHVKFISASDSSRDTGPQRS